MTRPGLTSLDTRHRCEERGCLRGRAEGALGPAVAVSPSLLISPSAASRRVLLGATTAAALALAVGPARAGEPAPASAQTTTPAMTGPQVPLAAPAADVAAPSVAITAVRHRLEYARRNGLRVDYTVTEASHLKVDVLIYGDVYDRELAMSALPGAGPGDSLAKATVAVAAGSGVARAAFNLPARRTLRKFLKLTVLVRLIAADAAGNETTAYKRVTLSNL